MYESRVFIQANLDTVWSGSTDLLEFPELYPAWTTEEVGEGTYLGRGPNGDEAVIRPVLNRGFGVVDNEVEAGLTVGRSRPRQFDVDETASQSVRPDVR